MREAACDICDRSRPPNHMEGWTVPNIWLDPEFGATFTANLLKGTQAILSWFLVLCFPELQFRIVWFSTISVIHHYHLQITGYWVYKLQNHLKSQFLYLSDYDNNHFCSICQCRRHRFDSWSGKISHAAEENNRMGKIREIFKKIRDIKGTFHAKMGSIKDRNGMDLIDGEA